MQVKVCSKCGAENAPNYPVCRKCQASLAGTAVVESGQNQQPASSPASAPLGPGPLNEYGNPVVQPQGRPSQPPPSQQGFPIHRGTGPQFNNMPSTPPEPKSNIMPIIGVAMMVVLICVAGFFALHKKPAPVAKPSVPADQVVMLFLQAKTAGDINAIMPHLCKSSVDAIENAFSSKQAQSAGFTKQDAYDMYLWHVPPTRENLQDPVIKVAVVEGTDMKEGTALVHASIKMRHVILGTVDGDFDYVLVIEDNQWKIDLSESKKANGEDKPVMPEIR